MYPFIYIYICIVCGYVTVVTVKFFSMIVLTSGLEPVDDEEGEGIVLRSAYPWEGTTRDYYYEEVRYLGFLPKSL
jgi:hypothetical protein